MARIISVSAPVSKKLPPKPAQLKSLPDALKGVKVAVVCPSVAKKASILPAKKVVSTPLTGVFSSYEGASKPVNSTKSKTTIDVSRFGKLPDATFTDRDFGFALDLKGNFGVKVFMRGQLDAGCIKRLGERGYLKYVSGELSTSFCTFQLTAKALKLGAAAKKHA